MQDKLQEFKDFVKDKPYLAKEVKDGKITWQTLYETFDLFGKEHDFFKDNNPKIDESTEKATNDSPKNEQFNKIIKSLQKVDTKKISDGLDNVKKIVGLIDDLRPTGTTSRMPNMRIKPFRRYND